MQRWEYLNVMTQATYATSDQDSWRVRWVNGVESASWKNGKPISKLLNEWGGDGWELVTVIKAGETTARLIFKRPTADAAASNGPMFAYGTPGSDVAGAARSLDRMSPAWR